MRYCHPIELTRLHQNDSFYDFVLKVCELVQDSLLPEEETGRFRFADILQDERKMGLVFQDFVRKFYRLEQNESTVTSDRIYWDATAEDADQFALLPTMVTDVSLRSKNRTIVIDTKYYRGTMQEHYGRERIHSDNLYQVFSYLKNLEVKGVPDTEAEGVLLYPTVTRDLDVRYTIQGHRLRVCTLDLSQEWRGIHDDLIALIH